MCEAIVNKASHSDRTVTTYLYSPKAAEWIVRALACEDSDAEGPES